MSDYQKNKEHFMIFREKFEDYFARYTYVYFKNKTDFMLWFIVDPEQGDSGDFLFGEVKDLGNMAFFFDKTKRADAIEFAKIKGLLVECCGLSIYDMDEAELKKLKRKIKRNLKSPEIVPEGQMPDEEARERFQRRISARRRSAGA